MIDVLSLMSGRWYAFNHYLYGLKNLDWPKEDLRIIWYSNANDMFIEHLAQVEKSMRKEGWNVETVVDQSLACSELALREDGYTPNHSNTITAIYNAAWTQVENDNVLLLEDDICAPSFSLQRFMPIMDKNQNAASVGGIVLDRHTNHKIIMGAWDITEDFRVKDDKPLFLKNVCPPRKTYGVQKVAGIGFGDTLIRRSRLPNNINGIHPFKTAIEWPEWETIINCDKILGIEINQGGKEVYADFETRPGHIDSRGTFR